MEKETKIVIIISLILPILFSLGVLTGYLFPPEGTSFSGFDFGQDQQFYASFIKESSLTFSPFQNNRFTTEFGMNSGGFVNILYWGLGLVVALTGLPVAAILIGFRILIEFLFFIILWKLIQRIFREKEKQIFAFVTLAVGGGIGWMASVGGIFVPVLARFMSGDTAYWLGFSTFGELFNVMFFAGMFFVLLAVHELFSYYETKNKKYAIKIGIIAVITYLIHPVSAIILITLIIADPIIRLFTSLNFKDTKKFILPAICVIGSGIIILAILIISTGDGGFAFVLSKYASGFQRTTSAFWYPIGYGFVLLFAMYGLTRNNLKEPVKNFIFAWLLVIFLLAINPWKGIRFHPYLHIPLVIFATEGFFFLLPKIKGALKRNGIRISKSNIIAITLVILCLSAPFIVSQHFASTFNQDVKSPFLDNDLIEVFNFLDKQKPGTLLAEHEICTFAPIYTPHYCYLGNWSVTPNNDIKTEKVQTFLDGTIETKKEFLKDNEFDYIIAKKSNSLTGTGYQIIFENSLYGVWSK